MGVSYTEAVKLVENEARQRALFQTEKCSLYSACDRVVAGTVYSPISTPEYDTSAMDGFALSSKATQTATTESPVIFEVLATTTAGDLPLSKVEVQDGSPCVEIMTGAPFPIGRYRDLFDCCIPIEEVVVTEKKGRRYISISRPARQHQHRRFSGGDFGKGDTILEAGQTVQPQHIMAMASVGLTEVLVKRKPRVAIFSTGCELRSPATDQSHPFMIHDVNGPYLTTMLRRWHIDADFCGVVPDDQEAMEEAISTALGKKYDMIITSGAVSAGRCDIIPSLVKRMGGRTVFHKVAVKPGHPILFSMIHREDQATSFFGLPGNPVAAAACLRVFVSRYVRTIQGQKEEQPRTATIQISRPDTVSSPQCNGAKSKVLAFRPEPDIFRPAVLTRCGQRVSIIDDHSPGKTKPFLHANCWVHIPNGVSELVEGSPVSVYPC